MRITLVSFLILLAACSKSSSATDAGQDAGLKSCPYGDLSQPIDMTIVDRTTGGTIESTMDKLPLIEPPQGGKVAFISVRAKNLDGCPLTITASLRDICDQSVIALQVRPIALDHATSDGFGEPGETDELFNFLNLPACPAAAAIRNIQGEQYDLTVRVDDMKNNKSAEKTIRVTPYCAESDKMNECLCECSTRAVLGEPCPANYDAGPSGLGCTGATDGGGTHD
jgi:hypothetical protein